MKDETWQKLVELGFDKVHQSDLAVGRECRAKLAFSLAAGRKRDGVPIVNAALGSVFNVAIDKFEQGLPYSDAYQFWSSCIEDSGIKEFRYGDGSVAPAIGLMRHCLDVKDGKSLKDYAFQCLTDLERAGITITASRVDVSNDHFAGEIDYLVEGPLGKGIVDLKTYGFWRYWCYGGSVQSQQWDENQIKYLPQLRHYEYMLGESVDFFAILCPTNMVPYMKGPKLGQRRGPTIFIAPSHIGGGYERDVEQWLESFAHSQPRDFPTNFGKPTCPSCKFFGPCMMGTEIQTPDFLEEDYDGE